MSNKLDIEEIAKEYTREEFLEEAKQRQMGKFDNEEDCPEFFNLTNIEECEPYVDCEKCWINAVKDIKFKGEISNIDRLNKIKKCIINSIEKKKDVVIEDYNNKINSISRTNNLAEIYYLLSETYGNTMAQGDLGIMLLKDNLYNDFFKNVNIKNAVNYIYFSNEEFAVLFSKSLVKEIRIIFKDSVRFKKYYRSVGTRESKLADLIEIFLNNKSVKNLINLTKHYNYKATLTNIIKTYKKCNKDMLDKIRYRQELDKIEIDEINKNNKLFKERQEYARQFAKSLIETDLKIFKNSGWKIKCENISDMD